MNIKNNVIEAISERRSIRKYTDEPVSHEMITTILEAGRWAPSGKNNQPWRFLVIKRDDRRMPLLADCTRYSQVILSAACIICVFLERDKIYSPIKDHQSVGAAMQNMLLAAHSLGLGAVWNGEILNKSEKLIDSLGFSSEKLELQAVIAVGHPDQKGSSKRVELKDLMLEDY